MASGYIDSNNKRYAEYEEGQIDGIVILDSNGNIVRKVDASALQGLGQHEILLGEDPVASISNGITQYLHLGTSGGTEEACQFELTGVKVEELRVNVDSNNLNSDPTITLRKDGSDTSLSDTISGTGNFTISGDSVTYDPAEMSLEVDTTSATSGSISIRCTIVLREL